MSTPGRLAQPTQTPQGWPIGLESATLAGFGISGCPLPGVDTPGWINSALSGRDSGPLRAGAAGGVAGVVGGFGQVELPVLLVGSADGFGQLAALERAEGFAGEL